MRSRNLSWASIGFMTLSVRPLIAANVPASQPIVVATTIEGKSIEGTWDGVGADGSIRMNGGQGKQTSIPAQEIMSVYFGGPTASQPTADVGFIFYLADAGQFAGQIVQGGSRDLQVSTGHSVPLHLSLDALAGIRFSQQASSDARRAFDEALAQRDPSQDVLVNLRQGRVTSIKGATQELSAQGGSFRWRERSIPILPDSAYGIVFASGVQKPSAATVQCTLRDASIWTGTLRPGDAQHVAIKSSLGPDLQFATGEVSELRFRSDRVVLLSNLTPKAYAFEPFVVTQWPWRKDRNVANGPLSLGGQTYQHGLGMHSQSRLVYELTATYSQLAATIGIDDAVRPRGSVVFRVLADGKEIFNSGLVIGGDPPRPILVALASAKKIELCVDFGDMIDIGDYADWAQIRLIK